VRLDLPNRAATRGDIKAVKDNDKNLYYLPNAPNRRARTEHVSIPAITTTPAITATPTVQQ
jgi:hypothetical protein